MKFHAKLVRSNLRSVTSYEISYVITSEVTFRRNDTSEVISYVMTSEVSICMKFRMK